MTRRLLRLSGVVLAAVTLAMPAPGTAAALQDPVPAPAPAPAEAPAPDTAEWVIARYRDAIGGEAAIRSHTSRTIRAVFEIPAQNMRGDLVILAAAPDRMLMTITLPGLGDIQRGFDGRIGWSIDPAIGPKLLDGRELDEMRHSADFYDDLHDPAGFTSITLVGRVPFAGEECYELKLVRPSGFEYTEYFSVKTGLLVGVRTNTATQMGSIPVTTFVGDYREFGGVLFPTVTRMKMMGLEQVITVQSIDFGEIDPKTFELPPSIAALTRR
ncbi:MAG TPA: hypothetical protein VF198_03155 [Vicinamibacterales bacterium]